MALGDCCGGLCHAPISCSSDRPLFLFLLRGRVRLLPALKCPLLFRVTLSHLLCLLLVPLLHLLGSGCVRSLLLRTGVLAFLLGLEPLALLVLPSGEVVLLALILLIKLGVAGVGSRHAFGAWQLSRMDLRTA